LLISGPRVNKGYDGAGLSFLHSNSYYLTGVTSVKDEDSNNSIAAFIEVKNRIKWISKLYYKYKQLAKSSYTKKYLAVV